MVTTIEPCGCKETRISFRRPKDGLSTIAPVSYRCAEHRVARRARDVKVRRLAAALTRPLPVALPAPALLLT